MVSLQAGIAGCTAGGAADKIVFESGAPADFIGGPDDVVSEIDVRGDSGPFQVTVGLLYPTEAVPFVDDLRDGLDPTVARSVTYVAEADPAPVTLATATIPVP